MSFSRFHLAVMTGWIAAIFTVLGMRVAVGMPATPADSLALLLMGCLPATILVFASRNSLPGLIPLSRATTRAERRTAHARQTRGRG